MVSSWWRMAVSGKQRPKKTGWGRCAECGEPAHVNRPHRLHTLDGKPVTSPYPE